MEASEQHNWAKQLREQQRANRVSQTVSKHTSDKKSEHGRMSGGTFVLWLFAAIITDILSLIPYLGVVASWPFALAFGAYKFIAKINWKKTLPISVADLVGETILSTLPVNTLDVVLTHLVTRKINS